MQNWGQTLFYKFSSTSWTFFLLINHEDKLSCFKEKINAIIKESQFWVHLVFVDEIEDYMLLGVVYMLESYFYIRTIIFYNATEFVWWKAISG